MDCERTMIKLAACQVSEARSCLKYCEKSQSHSCYKHQWDLKHKVNDLESIIFILDCTIARRKPVMFGVFASHLLFKWVRKLDRCQKLLMFKGNSIFVCKHFGKHNIRRFVMLLTYLGYYTAIWELYTLVYFLCTVDIFVEQSSVTTQPIESLLIVKW